MTVINSIDYTNNFNSRSKNNSVHFSAANKELPKDKNYYTFTKDKYDVSKNYKKIWAAELAASLALFGGYMVLSYKVLTPKIAKKFKKDWTRFYVNLGMNAAMGAGIILAPMLITIKLLTNKIKLHPISKDEQVKKEKEIKKTCLDVAKKKNTTVKNVGLYDFRTLKNMSWAIALFDYRSGDLLLDSKFKNTDLNSKEIMPFIVHELTHAEQFEKILRTKDGIYDLNNIAVRRYIDGLDKNFKEKLLNAKSEDIPALAKEDMQKHPENYYLINPEKEEKDEIKTLNAIKMYLENPKISKYKLPIIIDEDYYKKATENKPPLSEDDKQKVKNYLSYMNSDKYLKTSHNIFNASQNVSSYFDNPVEQEAYQAQFDYIKNGNIY